MRSRYEHILIPVDFSLKNQWAIDAAIVVAQANSARVTLLHIVETVGDVTQDQDIQEFLVHCSEQADAECERLSQPFCELGLPVDYHVRFGKRATDIVAYVEEHGVDLVILSSHPIDQEDPTRSLLTLSYKISLGVSCSVLLVKSPTRNDSEPVYSSP